MKREELAVGQILVGWTSRYGEFLIQVTAIKTPAGRKTRVVGKILKVIAPGIIDSFKYIGREWEFGAISVRKATEEDFKKQVSPKYVSSFNQRLKELDRLVSIKPREEYLTEQKTIREMMGV